MSTAMEHFRCRKCRHKFNLEESIIKEKDLGCTQSLERSTVWYIDVETCPQWIKTSIEKYHWTKGKLCCPKCSGRLGSFDFVTTHKCSCGEHPIPAIHIVKDRVDEILATSLPANLRSPRYHYDVCIPTQTTRVTTSLGTPNLDIISTTTQINDDNSHLAVAEVGVQDDVSNTEVDDVDTWNPFTVLETENDTELSDRENDDTSPEQPEEVYIPVELTCSVCLELFYRPYKCLPCLHVFCEPCLRQIAKQQPGATPCPLCRNVITKCVPKKEMTERIFENFEHINKERSHQLRKFNHKFYPLPICKSPTRVPSRVLTRYHNVPGTGTNISILSPTFIYFNSSYMLRQLGKAFKDVVHRYILIFVIYCVHQILYYLNTSLGLKLYTSTPEVLVAYLSQLTWMLTFAGVWYCIECCQLFHIEFKYHMLLRVIILYQIFYGAMAYTWKRSFFNSFLVGSLFFRKIN